MIALVGVNAIPTVQEELGTIAEPQLFVFAGTLNVGSDDWIELIERSEVPQFVIVRVLVAFFCTGTKPKDRLD